MDPEEPIVDGVEPNLVAQVTQLDTGHRGMGDGGTDLEQEGVDAIVLSVKDQTGIDGTVGAGLGQGAGPPLHGVEGRGVDLEFIRLGDEDCSCLQLAQVASMGQFRLRVANLFMFMKRRA